MTRLHPSIFTSIFKAVFDALDQLTLLLELQHWGVQGWALSWFCSYSLDRTQCVHFNHSFQKCSNQSSGAPQGSAFGLLFCIYLLFCICLLWQDKCGLKCQCYAESLSPLSSRLMSGLPGSAISDLKLIQDAAARILTKTSEHSRTTPVLAFLHLLLIPTRADYKTILLTYTVLNGPTHPP